MSYGGGHEVVNEKVLLLYVHGVFGGGEEEEEMCLLRDEEGTAPGCELRHSATGHSPSYYCSFM